jgi:hypothetical protein
VVGQRIEEGLRDDQLSDRERRGRRGEESEEQKKRMHVEESAYYVWRRWWVCGGGVGYVRY